MLIFPLLCRLSPLEIPVVEVYVSTLWVEGLGYIIIMNQYIGVSADVHFVSTLYIHGL